MPYSIQTKDGIKINNIPDDIPQDSDILKQRVQSLREQRSISDQQPVDTNTQPPVIGDKQPGDTQQTNQTKTPGELINEDPNFLQDVKRNAKAAFDAFTQAASFGFGDEMQGIEEVIKAVGITNPDDLSFNDIKQIYRENRDAFRQRLEQQAQESPVGSTVGELAGMFVPAAGAAKAATSIPKLVAGGAAQGAVRGLGGTEDITNVEQTAEDVAQGAALEGAIGGGLGLAGRAIGKTSSKMADVVANKRKSDIDDFAANLIAESIDQAKISRSAVGGNKSVKAALDRINTNKQLDQYLTDFSFKDDIKAVAKDILSHKVDDLFKPGMMSLASFLIDPTFGYVATGTIAAKKAIENEGVRLIAKKAQQAMNQKVKKFGGSKLYKIGAKAHLLTKSDPSLEKYAPIFDEAINTGGYLLGGTIHTSLLEHNKEYRDKVKQLTDKIDNNLLLTKPYTKQTE